jgi:hypothetical protein
MTNAGSATGHHLNIDGPRTSRSASRLNSVRVASGSPKAAGPYCAQRESRMAYESFGAGEGRAKRSSRDHAIASSAAMVRKAVMASIGIVT